MQKLDFHDLQLWQFDSLSAQAGIKHFVTDRNSNSGGKEFTLSYSSSPDRNEIQRNRHLLAEALEIDDNRLFFPSQVHLTNIVHVTEKTTVKDLAETDALITNDRGICIAVMSADCVPILIYDKRNNAVGAVHSGWRGAVAHILTKTLQAMHQKFGTTGEDIVATVGPSVCQDAYEVGGEVIEAVQQSFSDAAALLLHQPDGKAKLDLWAANRVQLRAFGVPESHIETGDLCSVKNNNYFFSARKGDSGRYAAGIMLV